MEFDYVFNPKNGLTFKVIPQEQVDPQEFIKRYENYVPQPPFMSPYVDEISIFFLVIKKFFPRFFIILKVMDVSILFLFLRINLIL